MCCSQNRRMSHSLKTESSRRRRVLTSRQLALSKDQVSIDERGRVWARGSASANRVHRTDQSSHVSWRVIVASLALPLLVLGALIASPMQKSRAPEFAVAAAESTPTSIELAPARTLPPCAPAENVQSMRFGGVVVEVATKPSGSRSASHHPVQPTEQECVPTRE